MADLLGSTASGFVVPFGGDKEEGVFVCSGDNGGDGVLVGQAKVLPLESIPVSVETDMGTTIPVSISNDTGIVVPISVSTTPFNTSIPLSIVNGTSIPETVDNVIEVNECQLATGQTPIRTPKRLTLSMPRIGKSPHSLIIMGIHNHKIA